MAERGYPGYDRYGNYDPQGLLLPSAGQHDDQGADEGDTHYAAFSAGAYDAPRSRRVAAPIADFYDDEVPGRSRRAAAPFDTPRTNRRTASGPASPAPALLPRTPKWTAPAALILGPALGVLLGQALGAYSGPGFAVTAVLAAMLAAASVSRPGLWWAVPAAPPAVWLAAVAAELTLHNPAYQGTKAEAVGLAHATVHAFPVMTAALAAALLVAVAGRFVTPAGRTAAPRRSASHA